MSLASVGPFGTSLGLAGIKYILKIPFFTGIWILSSGIAAFSITNIDTAFCFCGISPSNHHFLITFVIAFALPFLIIIVSYACIFYKLRQKLMLKKSQRKESRNIEMVDLNPQDGSEHFPESEDVPQVRESVQN